MSADAQTALPWWRSQGLVCAGGWHPLAARLRCEIQSEDAESDYAWEYTEEHVRRLREFGVTILIGQFDRGLGDSDQAEDQQRAAQLAALCHKHGLHHGVYLPNTIYFESVRKDRPDCTDWAVRTCDGRFIYYGGQQSFRWIACFNSPGWRERIRTQICRAIEVVKTDLLHFDNLGVWPEPESCHCKYCAEKFRAFLLKRYPTVESQKSRFGIAGVEHFDPPRFNMTFSPPWTIDRFTNPLMQEWMDFRCWTVSGYIREMAAYARSLKADICIDSNGQSVRGENQALLHGTDQEAQAEPVDIVWDENPDYREPVASEKSQNIFPVERKFRGLNFLRRLGKQVLTGYDDEESLAFNLTFAGDPGINVQWGYAEPGKLPLRPAQPGVAELLAHYKRHLHLYTNMRPAARIALWRNRQSLAYISTDTHLSACVLEQVLFNHRIPFSIAGDSFIQSEKLSAFDLLILPDVEFLGDEHAATVLEYVKRGGAVLVTENTGVFTDRSRRRRRPVFAHLFENSLRQTLDAGRAAYLPTIDYVHKPHSFRSNYCTHYDGIDSRYWRAPGNAAEIIDLIRWLRPRFQNVCIESPAELRLDHIAWPDGNEGVTLLRCGKLSKPADVRLKVQRDTPPKNARLYLPQSSAPLPLEWKRASEHFETLLPGVERHAVVQYEN